MEKENIVLVKSLDFGVEIVRFCEELQVKRKFIVANQLLKSGTSVGANIFEAQHAESKTDFIHKMKIAIKEANETLYWLNICERCESYPANSSLKLMIEELIRIISKIIISSKRNFNNGKFSGILTVTILKIIKLKSMLTGV